MSVTVLKPEDWRMQAPLGHGRGRHPYMRVNEENPHVTVMEEAPHAYTETHSHNIPEVFTILAGRIFFNGQWCSSGSVIFVPAHEDYWYSTGAERCVIARICPTDRGAKINSRELAAADVD